MDQVVIGSPFLEPVMTAIAAICNEREAVLAADRQFSDAKGNSIAEQTKTEVCERTRTAFAVRGVSDNKPDDTFCVYRIVRGALQEGGTLSVVTARVSQQLLPALQAFAQDIVEHL